MFIRLIPLFTFAITLMTSPVCFANPLSFEDWLEGVRTEARQKNISEKTIQQALTNVQLQPAVLELDRHQPETKLSFSEYLHNTLPAARIKKALSLVALHKPLLNEISTRYGVPAPYIVALWGIESNFGENMGNFPVIPALATLAYDGRRSALFRRELLVTLNILDQNQASLRQMIGSWAGAMGQSQFMPSSFQSYAIDYNQDGRRDIWGTPADVFASIANYLSSAGWDRPTPWGTEVSVPADIDSDFVGIKIQKKLSAWENLGVTPLNSPTFPEDQKSLKASLVAPDGLKGRTFLVYDNYHTVMNWNRSTYFATAVGLFADALAKDTSP